MKMKQDKKIIISSFLIVGALSTAIITSALNLHNSSNNLLYEPDPVTQKEIAQARAYGKENDWSKAAEILRRNAVGANVQAKYEYAMLYAKGWGVTRDLEKARNLLLQAVQSPFKDRARAAFELGRVYRMSKGEDCARISFEWFNKAAQWGYLKAHSDIGKSYARGIGVNQDVELALKHYRIAATQSASTAVLPLVELLATGSSTVPADPDKAIEILNEFMPRLEEAARGGDARAARSIGRLYVTSQLVEPNEEKALKWLSMASSLGDAIAMHDMALLVMETKKHFAEKEEVLGLLQESINRNYAAAITTLGRLHLKSKFGLPERKAVDLFKQGVAAGHTGSMEELGRLYFQGKYVQHDLEKARELAKLGAGLKHSGSKKLLEEIIKAEKSTAQNTSISLASGD
jgi:TPR repeat protein